MISGRETTDLLFAPYIYGNQQYPFQNWYDMQVDVLPVMSITTDTEAQILRELPTRCVNISQVIYNFNLNYGYLNYINRKWNQLLFHLRNLQF